MRPSKKKARALQDWEVPGVSFVVGQTEVLTDKGLTRFPHTINRNNFRIPSPWPTNVRGSLSSLPQLVAPRTDAGRR